MRAFIIVLVISFGVKANPFIHYYNVLKNIGDPVDGYTCDVTKWLHPDKLDCVLGGSDEISCLATNNCCWEEVEIPDGDNPPWCYLYGNVDVSTDTTPALTSSTTVAESTTSETTTAEETTSTTTTAETTTLETTTAVTEDTTSIDAETTTPIIEETTTLQSTTSVNDDTTTKFIEPETSTPTDPETATQVIQTTTPGLIIIIWGELSTIAAVLMSLTVLLLVAIAAGLTYWFGFRTENTVNSVPVDTLSIHSLESRPEEQDKTSESHSRRVSTVDEF